MKTYLKITLILLTLFFTACVDVIEVPIQNEDARLVVEASIDWEKGTNGANQTISLRTSTPFFETTNNTAVTGALVSITNDSDGRQFVFTDQNNGDYTTDEFVPVVAQSYTLEIVYNGETYLAQETLKSVTDFTEIYQATEDGFDEEDLEVHVVFTDPPELGNNYLFKFQTEGDLLPALEVGYDEFVNGNEIDWWYEKDADDDSGIEAFAPGDVVTIEMYGISTDYKNYLEILIGQIGGVGLFDATPVAVKGNCINTTNAANYAHGYFRLTQFNKVEYTFE